MDGDLDFLLLSAYLFKNKSNLYNHIDATYDLWSIQKWMKDEGKLLAHKAFWQYPESTRFDATITEMIYVPNHVIDGTYLLNIQIAPFVNDASPSKPVLYKIED